MEKWMATDGTLTVARTEHYLLQQLEHAGINLQTVTVVQLWEAFKDFAHVDVTDCPELELLVEWGVYNFHLGRDTFQLGFVRQFSMEEDGEYAGMEQLHCIFFFEPTPELELLQGNMWSFNYPTLDSFFAEVEMRDAFKLASTTYRPIEVRVMQWAV